jgi:hypothetical protein
MIVFDLSCTPAGHAFEGWFGSLGDFAEQKAGGLLCCPICGSEQVERTLSVPKVGAKGNQSRPSLDTAPAGEGLPATVSNAPTIPAEMVEVMHKIAELQHQLLAKSEHVGDKFAETARAIHYGEQEDRLVHGQASAKEASELLEEGIAIAPLPLPIIPPDQKN